MKKKSRSALLLLQLIVILTLAARLQAQNTGACGGVIVTIPFTDVSPSSVFFCAIAEAYFSGLTNGTGPTTYSPTDPVPRDQMAAFVTRTQDSAIKRSSRRAALNQWYTLGIPGGLTTAVGANPQMVACDGADLWVAARDGTVTRVRASDGALLGEWTGATGASGVLVAKGVVWITGQDTSSGKLFYLSPSESPRAVQDFAALRNNPYGMATDGTYIWTANNSGSVSKVSLVGTNQTFTNGFIHPIGVLFDGSNIWVTDQGGFGSIDKLDGNGNTVQQIIFGDQSGGIAPVIPVFDGTNIRVPLKDNTVAIIRASTGSMIASLSGNGLNSPVTAAFDGQRILVTNFAGGASLWRASDLTPIGVEAYGYAVNGACSDGIKFFVVDNQNSLLVPF